MPSVDVKSLCGKWLNAKKGEPIVFDYVVMVSQFEIMEM